MTGYLAALYGEALKLRRSLLPWLVAAAFAIGPLAGGLFMIILKDPEHARQMGLLGTKAQLAAGAADWPSYLALLAQVAAAAGGVLFAFLTAWVFGREFADRTVRTVLALPTPRWALVAAKGTVVAGWALVMTCWMLAVGLTVGWAVDIPGFSVTLLRDTLGTIAVVVAMNIGLQSVTALIASSGRGYLGAVGWTFLSLALANLFAVLGHGAWFPWAVPALVTGMAGPEGEVAGPASYALVAITAAAGLAATFAWWQRADQAG